MTRRTIANLLTGGTTRNLRLIMATAAACVAAAVPAGAQQADPREVGGFGDLHYPDPNCPLDDVPLWETDIAAGVNRVMAVYRVGPVGSSEHIGYSLATKVDHIGGFAPIPPEPEWFWTKEDIVPFAQGIVDIADPTVAYDSVTGNFVLAGMCGNENLAAVAIWDLSLRDFAELEPNEPGWVYIDVEPSIPQHVDKPTILAGEVIGAGQDQYQEFYMSFFAAGLIPWWLRSTDGGYTWRGGEIWIDGQPVFPPIRIGQAVHDDSPLYVGYQGGAWGGYAQAFGFVKGEDPNTPDDPMTWSYLDTDNDPNNGTLRIGLNAGAKIADWVPAPGEFPGHIYPEMAVDPADPDNVVYVVYDDVADPNEIDDPNVTDVNVDVFLVKLTRDPQTDTWSAGDRVLVNDLDDPNAPTPSDQFLPSVTATPGPTAEQTRVHVIFYDDRRFPSQSEGSADPKFDVYYAYSRDAGTTFEENLLLFLDDPDDPNDPPAADYELVPDDPNHPNDPSGRFVLRDYIGIDAQPEGSGYRIWTSYMGTCADDPTEHPTVIWSSQIRWLFP